MVLQLYIEAVQAARGQTTNCMLPQIGEPLDAARRNMIEINNTAALHFWARPLRRRRRKIHSPKYVISGYCRQNTPPRASTRVLFTFGAKVIQLDDWAHKQQIVEKPLVVLINVAFVCQDKSKTHASLKPRFLQIRHCDYAIANQHPRPQRQLCCRSVKPSRIAFKVLEAKL